MIGNLFYMDKNTSFFELRREFGKLEVRESLLNVLKDSNKDLSEMLRFLHFVLGEINILLRAKFVDLTNLLLQ